MAIRLLVECFGDEDAVVGLAKEEISTISRTATEISKRIEELRHEGHEIENRLKVVNLE